MDTINSKPFQISKQLVWEAWKLVKANAGSAGVDKESLEDFERNLKDNLYKLWNRMTSGSYMSPPVKGVAIPKKSGGQRMLGVPCVADRIAQTVVKLTFEPIAEKVFLPDSYGYRPNKSAHDAIDITRQRFNECGLELHPEKTKIVYCKDSKRKQEYPINEFKFLGFTFISRTAMNQQTKELFNSFQPAVSKDALKAMRKQVKLQWKLHLRSEVSLEILAEMYNPVIRGWIQYYGKFYKTELSSLANYINMKLVRWARRKYKSLKIHKQKAYDWLVRVCNANPTLFEYWKLFKVC